MVTDSLRPYVDHDFPFDGVGVVRERVENMLELQLDNSDALEPKPHGWPRSPEERMGEGPPSVRCPSALRSTQPAAPVKRCNERSARSGDPQGPDVPRDVAAANARAREAR